ESYFDRICKRIHAAQHAITRIRRKFYFLRSHCGLLLSCLPSVELKIKSIGLRRLFELGGGFDDAEDVALLHDEQVLAIDPHFRAGPLAKQDSVARLDG